MIRAAALLFLWTTGTHVLGQSIDSLRVTALRAAKQTYQQNVRGQSLVQQGIEIAVPPKGVAGSPYLWEDFLSGRLVYDGVAYENVPLQYDAVNEWVLTEHPYGFFPMLLVQGRVSGFEVGRQTFRWLEVSGATPGFYEILRAGRVTVWAKRRKELRERVIDNKSEKAYNPIDQFFLEKAGTWYRINTRKQLWAVMGDKKAAIKKRWALLGVEFNREKERALVEAASLE